MHIMKDSQGITLYSGHKRGRPFIGFFPKLHHGWQSSKRYKHGLLYFEPAILVGRIYTEKTKWIWLGTYYWPDYLTRGYHKYKDETWV
jgi:hypothetical protein